MVIAAVGLVLGLITTTNSTAASASKTADDGTAAAVAYINAQDTGTVTEISAGGNHSCAITTAEVAYCWGANDVGQLGSGSTLTTVVPVQVAGGAQGGDVLTGVSEITAGYFHTCALTRSETSNAYCWGLNANGQLGNDDDRNLARDVPLSVTGLSDVSDISAGYRHTCAITTDEFAYCWGDNKYGQLGNGEESSESRTPVQVAGGAQGGAVLTGVSEITAGGGSYNSSSWRSHSCAIAESEGIAFCWGNNEFGQLGNAIDGGKPETVPVQVCAADVADGQGCNNTFLIGVTQISAGQNHTCAITGADAGTALCWGSNQVGELGTQGQGNSGSDSSTPVAVAAGNDGFPNGSIADVSAGGGQFGSQTCAVTADATVYCWGSNDDGQLGNGDTGGIYDVPVLVESENGFDSRQVEQVSVGGAHTCALTGGAAVFCWGDNNSRQLGNGTFGGGTDVPVPVAGQLRVDPASVDFGTVASGKSKEENVTLASSFPLSSGAIVIDIKEKPAGSDARRGFSFSPEQGCDKKDSDTIRLTDGTQCTGVVEFAPTQPGTYGGKVLLQPRDFPNVGVEFAASGYSPAGSNPGGAVVKADPVDFGKVDIFTAKNKKVKIKNTGDEALKISGAKVRNDPQDEFDVKLGECGESAVPPGKTCQLKVQFFPRVVGESAALLELKSNAIGSATIALSGEGISNPPLTDEQGRPVDEDGKLLSLGPVRKLSAKTVMTKKAVVQWKRPKTKLTVTQYEARVKQCVKQRGSWNCNKPKWRGWRSVDPDPNFQGFITRTYKKLTPATKYKVQVRALSYDLLGEKSVITFITKKSGIPTKVGNG